MECPITLKDIESIEKWINNCAVKHIYDGGVTFFGILLVIQTLKDKIAELKALLNEQE